MVTLSELLQSKSHTQETRSFGPTVIYPVNLNNLCMADCRILWGRSPTLPPIAKLRLISSATRAEL
jgi:hypothetical protein